MWTRVDDYGFATFLRLKGYEIRVNSDLKSEAYFEVHLPLS